MLPSVMASDPAHDPNTFPVEALKKPHVLSTYHTNLKAAIRVMISSTRERLVSTGNLLRLKRNAPRPENSILQLRERNPR